MNKLAYDPSVINHFYPRLLGSLWGLLLAGAMYQAYYSFSWINTHDTGLMYYVAWLINAHNYIPYKDVLDTSFPGSYLLHILVGRLIGHDSFSFHIADLFSLLCLLYLTWRLIVPAGKLTAFGAITLYTLYYYANHPTMHFQRDYLALIPIVSGILILINPSSRPGLKQYIFSGMLFGFAAAIKPQLAIGAPIAFLCSFTFNKGEINKNYLLPFICMGFGVLLCFSLLAIWLISIGAMDSFIQMVQNYLPIYLLPEEASQAKQSDWQVFVLFWQSGGVATLLSLVMSQLAYWLTSIAGVFWLWKNQENDIDKKLILLFLLVLPAYLISALLGFKSWAYHAMPFHYFALISAALIFKPALKKNTTSRFYLFYPLIFRCVLLAVLLITGIISTPTTIHGNSDGNHYQKDAANDLVGFMKEYALEKNIALKNQKAQPITMNPVGPILAILQQLDLTIPTRFLECWVCYHQQLNDPRAIAYRKEFFNGLSVSRPQFLFVDRFYWLRLASGGEKYSFPELTQFVSAQYHIIYQTDYIAVYARNET